MTGLLLGAASAFWLGILTSISPCPLATNIAAISFVSRRVGTPRKVFLTGLLYTAGRTLAYLALKLAGHTGAEPFLARSRDAILAAGGSARCDGLSQFYLALFSQAVSPIPNVSIPITGT